MPRRGASALGVAATDGGAGDASRATTGSDAAAAAAAAGSTGGGAGTAGRGSAGVTGAGAGSAAGPGSAAGAGSAAGDGSAAGAGSAAATGAAPTASPASPITARGVPTLTVSPSATRMSMMTPDAGDGTSVSTLSVEISSKTSSSAIVSPGCLAQLRMVPSVTVSPSWGIVTVTAMWCETPQSLARSVVRAGRFSEHSGISLAWRAGEPIRYLRRATVFQLFSRLRFGLASLTRSLLALPRTAFAVRLDDLLAIPPPSQRSGSWSIGGSERRGRVGPIPRRATRGCQKPEAAGAMPTRGALELLVFASAAGCPRRSGGSRR